MKFIKKNIALILLPVFFVNTTNLLAEINSGQKEEIDSIRNIKLFKDGKLKIRFCDKLKDYEGFVTVGNRKYDVRDAYKIKKSKLVWLGDNQPDLDKGKQYFVSTDNLKARPHEEDDDYNLVKLNNGGCGALAYIKGKGNSLIKISSGGSAPFILGVAIIAGIAAGGTSSSGSGTTSSN